MSTFPAEGVRFLAKLAANNDREWFAAHKAEFEEFVNKPSQEFFESYKSGLALLLGTEIDGKLYRIHRDVRFSKDQTPYSTHIRFSAWKAGSDPKSDCCFHVSIESDKQVLGVGVWEFGPEILTKFQSQITAGEVDQLITSLGEVRLSEPELKRIPKEALGNSEHYRRKGLTMWFDIPWHGNDIQLSEWLENLQRLAKVDGWMDL